MAVEETHTLKEKISYSLKEKEAYSIPEFMHVFGVCRATVYHEINQGRLRAKKSGKRTFISIQSAQDWFAALPDYGVEAA